MNDLDTYGRMILSASPQSPTFIRIYTDDPQMKLRIRVLESLTQKDPELLQEIHILKFSGACNLARLPIVNGTLTPARPGRGAIDLVAAFVHQSRVFYVNKDRKSDMILSENFKFFTTLPSFLEGFWNEGGFTSYDETLFFVPAPRRLHERFYRSLALFTTQNIFHTYEIMLYELQEHHFELLMSHFNYRDRMHYIKKSVMMFNNEVLVITGFEQQYYNGQIWEKFVMNGLPGTVHINFHPMGRVKPII